MIGLLGCDDIYLLLDLYLTTESRPKHVTFYIRSYQLHIVIWEQHVLSGLSISGGLPSVVLWL